MQAVATQSLAAYMTTLAVITFLCLFSHMLVFILISLASGPNKLSADVSPSATTLTKFDINPHQQIGCIVCTLAKYCMSNVYREGVVLLGSLHLSRDEYLKVQVSLCTGCITGKQCLVGIHRRIEMEDNQGH